MVASASGKLARSGMTGSASSGACSPDVAASTSGAFRLALPLGAMAKNCYQLVFCEAASLKQTRCPVYTLSQKHMYMEDIHVWVVYACIGKRCHRANGVYACIGKRCHRANGINTNKSIPPISVYGTFSIYIDIMSSSYVRKSEG